VEAIRPEWQGQLASFANLPTEVLNVVSTNRGVLSERIDSVHMVNTDRDVCVHSVNVFELDPDGRIKSHRDYFDMKEVEAQDGGA
jgi:limonene-1,2-epoxide hydrolase